MITHTLEIHCEEALTSAEYGTNDVKVELRGVRAEDIFDIALEICDKDIIAERMVLEHLEEVLNALSDVENESDFIITRSKK